MDDHVAKFHIYLGITKRISMKKLEILILLVAVVTSIVQFYKALELTIPQMDFQEFRIGMESQQHYSLSDIGSRIRIPQHQDVSSSADIKIKQCLERRGTDGSWYRDDNFSWETFYLLDTRSRLWFKANPEFANRTNRSYKGNRYNWRDHHSEDCDSIQPVTLEGFCNIMSALEIRRILFVGDSLALSQRASLFRLITAEHQKTKQIQCPSHLIHFNIFRENLGPNFRAMNASDYIGQFQQYGPETPLCDATPLNSSYCSWHVEYNSNMKDKTLLVLNQGAHFHSLETFSNSLDLFVDNYNALPHPGDIVVFRSTVPGHKDCWNKQAPGIPIPEMTHDKFLERYGTAKYDWNLFDAYNQYAKKTLYEKLDPRVTFHYLNVYNMTVLRNDEHVSQKDCLHYTNPGPVDFWNHLLFTNLADLSKLQKSAIR